MKRLRRDIVTMKSQGFSLMEVLVTAFIFSVVIGSLYATLNVGDRSWSTNSVLVQLQQELRKAMGRIKNDLRGAGASSISNVPADGNWYSSITFQVANGVSLGSVSWDSDAIAYAVAGSSSDQLQRTVGSSSMYIAQNITSCQFRRQSTSVNIVEVLMTAQKDDIKGNPLSSTLSFTVRLRN